MIELKNLSYSVLEDGVKKDILKNLNLTFKKNKITAITGHNGSGKSTLIKLLMGINEVSEGKIFVNGKDITQTDISYRANNGITLAFQQPVKFKGLTVKDVIDIASRKNNNVKESCSYLSMVGLCAKDYLDRTLDDTLSGGELKRIELATALAKGGEIFLFDEPEAGIDLWSFDELLKIFKSLKNKTVIIVSHQQKILELADYILILSSANPPLMGKKEEIIEQLNSEKLCNKLSGGIYGQN